MDGQHFDKLTRALATGTSRRRVLAGLLGGLVGLNARGGAAAGCREAGRRCTSPGHCCSGICDPGSMTCACPPGTTNCRGACAAPAAFLNDVDNCGGCGIACPLSSDPCQVAVCQGGVCGFVPGNDAAACDDHNACTEGDTCLAGVCTGRPVTCANDNPCLTATCDPATGCGAVPKDPGIPCGTGPTCVDGAAKAQDTCNGSGGCQPGTTTPCGLYRCNGAVCGASCTEDAQCVETAHCDNNQCQGDLPLGQPCDEDSDCASGHCNPVNNICCADACAAGAPCSGSGNTCGCPTGQQLCGDGGCHACCADADCAGLNGPCAAGVCDPVLGCRAVPKDAGTSCGSPNGCTAAPLCDTVGNCRAGQPKQCQPCHRCVGNGTCVRDENQNGLPCDGAGDLCFARHICQEGACVGRDPKQCEPFDECHGGICDPQTGGCDPYVLADGTSCASDQACSVNDTCQGGVCTDGTGLCVADNVCKTSRCTDQGVCLESIKPFGTACGVGDACTGDLACNLFGQCVPGSPVSCGECTICDPETGSCLPANEGGTCAGSGDRCFGAFVCRGGSCVGEQPVVCTALDQCHLPGTCQPTTGICSNPEQSNDTPCDVQNLCHTGGTCQDGVCSGGESVACEQPRNNCRQSTCEPQTGNCVESVIACVPPNDCYLTQTCDPTLGLNGACPPPLRKVNGSVCNAGRDDCTSSSCNNGTCVTVPITCDQPESFCQITECSGIGSRCLTRDEPNGRVRKNCLEATCLNGVTVTEPAEYCHGCGTCDPTTGTCVGSRFGEVCDHTCSATSRCFGPEICLVVQPPEEPCSFGDECSDLVCDSSQDRCVDTGSKNGQACTPSSTTGCGICQNGACSSVCPACTTCEGLSGRCVPCEHCCNGQCGFVECTDGGGGRQCLPPHRVCDGGRCLSNVNQFCCPDGNTWCNGDQTCCPGAPCCAAGETCCPGEPCCPAGKVCCQNPFSGVNICCNTCDLQGGCGLGG